LPKKGLFIYDSVRIGYKKNGKADYFEGVILDITEQKKEQEYSDKILKTMADGLGLVDRTGKFIDVNPSFVKMFGYKNKEEFLKNVKSPLEMVSGAEKKKMIKGIVNTFKKGIDINEYHGFKKDGSKIKVEVHAVPLSDQLGEEKSLVNVRDITERKKAEEEREKLRAQLIQSEKMAGIGTLTSGIAHEFNNLLQIMRGNVEFAHRTKKPEDMEEALDIVGNTSDRVSKIIKDLLTFSSREALERKLSSIPELIDFILSMTEEHLKKHNIDVIREYGRVPKVEVNTGEIQQVFLNMVTNARDAMLRKGGKLEIRTKKVKDHVEISFTDTGIGIEEKKLGRVFEPFYTTKGAVGGDCLFR